MSRRSARTIPMLCAAALLVLAACSKSPTSSPASGGASATGSTTGGSVTVSTASVPGMGTVLVDARGFTLYELPTESSGTIKCTGSCATSWPPLLLPSGVTSATAGSGVTAGALGTIARPDGGTQVTFHQMPLYLYVGDSSPGQATGQGVAGFSVATATASGHASQSPSSGGYGY